MLRLVPRARGEARHAEVWPRHVLRRAERLHPREVEPRPGAIERVLVDYQELAHAFAHEPEGCGEPALPGAHDHDVVDGGSGRGPSRLHPLAARVVDELEIAPHLLGEAREPGNALGR